MTSPVDTIKGDKVIPQDHTTTTEATRCAEDDRQTALRRGADRVREDNERSDHRKEEDDRTELDRLRKEKRLAEDAAEVRDALELSKWRNDVDLFISDSTYYRRDTTTRLDSMDRDLKANTAMTTEMHTGLKDALPVIVDFAGGARTLKRAGSYLKPLLYVGGFLGAVVFWAKTGKWVSP